VFVTCATSAVTSRRRITRRWSEVQDREGHVVEHRQSEDETCFSAPRDEGDAPVHRVAVTDAHRRHEDRRISPLAP